MVEGWNRHEAERTEVLRGLQEERQAAELTRSKQQEVGNLGLRWLDGEGGISVPSTLTPVSKLLA